MAESIKRVIYSVLILLVFASQPAVGQPPSIFFTRFDSKGRIYSDDLDGGNPSILVENLDRPKAIAIDWSVTPHQMYIGIIGDGKITRYDVDGTNPVDIITDQVGINDIELDLESRTIYWLKDTYSDDQIFRADMDGLNSNISSLYATTTTNRSLWGLALDIPNDRLWFTERGSNCLNSRLRRMSLNGTEVTTLIDNICNPHDIEYFNGHIYYLMDDGLIKADMDGTGQVNISEAADDAISLTVDGVNSRVYWTNFTSVERINLDGTGLTTILSGVSPLQGIDIGLGISSRRSGAMPWIPLLLLDTETFSLRSSSFSDGAPIPVQHSLQGGNLSPPLSWNNAPANTQSFVLIMDDPDAPGATWDHWIVYDIPAGTTSLAEDAGASGDGGLPSGAEHGTNSWGNDYYQGPAPPSGTHRYYFKLYALSVSQLNPSGTNKTAIEAAMTGKILGQTELMGTYTYNP